jgi:hypothetical protein
MKNDQQLRIRSVILSSDRIHGRLRSNSVPTLSQSGQLWQAGKIRDDAAAPHFLRSRRRNSPANPVLRAVHSFLVTVGVL